MAARPKSPDPPCTPTPPAPTRCRPGGTYATGPDYADAATINNVWLSARGYRTPAGDITPKIYAGKADISGTRVAGAATFVASDSITFSGNNITLAPYSWTSARSA
ncbi:MAG: hypothetical protein QOI35_1896 [Cryptosporangiaceae bacterium]|nr:hypothetical protein [Cryptosporangiaceae bacterium]